MSRIEKILQSILDGTDYTDPPLSRIEALYLRLKQAFEKNGRR